MSNVIQQAQCKACVKRIILRDCDIFRKMKNSTKCPALFSQQRNFFHFVSVSSIKRITLFSIFWVSGQKSALCITVDLTFKTKNSHFYFQIKLYIKL